MPPFEMLGIGEALWDLLPTGPVLGGAPCNFSFHCNQLGHSSAIVSRVGNDELGAKLRNQLRQLQLADELVQIDEKHPTGTVAVHLDAAGHPTYAIAESVAWDHLELDERNSAAVVQAKVLCFGSLAQRHQASRTAIQNLLQRSRIAPGRRTHIFDVNLRQHFYNAELLDASLRLADWVKLNEDELAVLTNLFQLSGVSPESRLAALRERYQLSLACVTRGEEGCLVVSADESIDEPGICVKVVDTVGAGDAFTAGLACLILEGKPLRSAVRFANRLAARVAASAGATPNIARASIKEHE